MYVPVSTTPWSHPPTHHSAGGYVAFGYHDSLRTPEFGIFDAQLFGPHTPLPIHRFGLTADSARLGERSGRLTFLSGDSNPLSYLSSPGEPWHYPHQLHGITLTSCMALPAPVAWHCPHQLHGIARTDWHD